ncbi:signal recognition particle, SRP9/SRP14 subunit [Dendrothele bispora CBS 962.96]|uniref:Signal recognition particle, SRP9/SRP14 subunit n=1 Tax=Dendrothele bispora (strain CBS 962.96) TaxID=1314807 RepID=A0A4S8LFK6_DENBC|nr:signal recognition particle, SRP9/SRP14 subunit [Dendrothele bispora CBS 962.96]
MVYIQSWQEYQEAAEDLYKKSPNTTRYCVKWKSSEGKLVLKITDNVSCIKFKTYSSIFLNRFEALNLSLMEKMQNKRVTEAPAPEATKAEPSSSANPAPAAPVVPTPSATTSGGVTKKKKPKKKK